MSNKTFKKVSVVKLSTNFTEATKVVEVLKVNESPDCLIHLVSGPSNCDGNARVCHEKNGLVTGSDSISFLFILVVLLNCQLLVLNNI